MIKSLSKRIHISKKNVVKLALFLVVMAAAFLFDMSREKSDVVSSDKHTASGTQSHQLSQFCFYSTFSTFKLKGASDDRSDLSLFQKQQSRFLQQYHNLKVSQLARFEPDSPDLPSELLSHFIQLRKYLYHSPDDSTLPLA